MITFLIILFGYILGSIPFGLIVSRLFKKDDPRKYGSKNIGATNITRISGWKLGSLTLLFDVLKAFIPIKICLLYNQGLIPITSLAVFIGHLYPVWIKFKGGKGVAVFIGILFGISKIYGLIYLLCWIIVAYISRYSSLAAIVSSILILITMILFKEQILFWLILILNIMIFIKHKDNIRRIFNNTESKINFKK